MWALTAPAVVQSGSRGRDARHSSPVSDLLRDAWFPLSP